MIFKSHRAHGTVVSDRGPIPRAFGGDDRLSPELLLNLFRAMQDLIDGHPIRGLKPDIYVIAQQLPNRPALGGGQHLGAQVRRADRVRLVEH